VSAFRRAARAAFERAFARAPAIERASATEFASFHTMNSCTSSPSSHWLSCAAANACSSPETTTTGRHTCAGASSASSARLAAADNMRTVDSARSMYRPNQKQ